MWSVNEIKGNRNGQQIFYSHFCLCFQLIATHLVVNVVDVSVFTFSWLLKWISNHVSDRIASLLFIYLFIYSYVFFSSGFVSKSVFIGRRKKNHQNNIVNILFRHLLQWGKRSSYFDLSRFFLLLFIYWICFVLIFFTVYFFFVLFCFAHFRCVCSSKVRFVYACCIVKRRKNKSTCIFVIG